MWEIIHIFFLEFIKEKYILIFNMYNFIIFLAEKKYLIVYY